ncbi:hypothetical protein AU14_02870 [Marinobacter similis]|uniref:Uncharacterized protein n=1 Tax=Marinobacter similis TaxID=1420916 RepID=W5YLL9_9GAMM|nr:hypothetical protein AU14_02870 [Marinobacter similis]
MTITGLITQKVPALATVLLGMGCYMLTELGAQLGEQRPMWV